jgi:hypothetical protein
MMASDKPIYCSTCDSFEPHRPLSGAEKTWLKDRIRARNVDNYLMCTAQGCRNLRTGMNKAPFAPELRVPPPPK